MHNEQQHALLRMIGLQGIVFLVIFAEIQCFWLRRDPLAGVIGKFAAFSGFHDNAFFNAEDLPLIDFCSVGAIGAGFWHFAAEKHGENSFVCFSMGYYT